MATPKQAAKKASKKRSGRPLREGRSDLPRGPCGLAAAPRPVCPPHRRVGRCVHGGGAGVPDSRAAGAVREGGEPAGKEAEAPDTPHGDACRAPRRRPRHAPEGCDAVAWWCDAEPEQGAGEEAQEQQEGEGDAQRLERPSGQAQRRGATC
ncbi:putative histone H2A [Trypanosoma cruzi]|uniref:Putative histone H2A n=1 Tax=Trypanosoma cruzi TaxID=5693 RepID=A0A2V2VI92_TRYCR|nr:putative histone H2A [Trypanosoma cruzi]